MCRGVIISITPLKPSITSNRIPSQSGGGQIPIKVMVMNYNIEATTGTCHHHIYTFTANTRGAKEVHANKELKI
ncbi:unnamed protein product [Cuscuta campestris]|uniref:Uncharacterized protein n=1 Tax=Cuscuta campestris TaxID=132261 RepID=A0A484L666_9ASTE|nr:unnamed protein product [Cuscuta campestris]